MFYLLTILPFFLLLTGVCGILLGRKNIILIIMSLELMLLALTFHYVLNGWCVFGDFKSIIFGIFILSLGASESAIGLALAICYYKNL